MGRLKDVFRRITRRKQVAVMLVTALLVASGLIAAFQTFAANYNVQLKVYEVRSGKKNKLIDYPVVLGSYNKNAKCHGKHLGNYKYVAPLNLRCDWGHDYEAEPMDLIGYERQGDYHKKFHLKKGEFQRVTFYVRKK